MLEWLIYWGIFVSLYSWGEAYIWNEASVSICGGGGGLYSGGLIFGWGLIVGGLR